MFTGEDVGVRLDGAQNVHFQIVLDGVPTGVFQTDGGEALYPLASGVGSGEHTIEIVRRNEGYFGVATFLGFELASGAIVPSPWPYAHRIEFIGDSLTCGYGIEGASARCNFSADTESAYASYASVASRALGAAAHLICYSGKGVHQNYGGDTNEPMPAIYPRTLTDDASSTWDPAEFQADAVVINLGTNDFSAALDERAFVGDYRALIATVRARHPQAFILAITWEHWGAGNQALVEQAVSGSGDGSIGTLAFSIDPADGLGCDYHTNVVTNQKLGALLGDTLKEQLGW
jgi:lysophospholipase L1-like esterase